jgi:membrane associated rhomboid family serine protease
VLLLVPLGSEEERGVRPWATIALVALNVLLFVWTSRFAADRAAASEAELDRIAAWTIERAAAEAPALAATAAQQASVAAFLSRDVAWREEVRSPALRERLEAIVEDYAALRRSHPFYVWGLVPAGPWLVRLITHQFLHADALHLLFNMVFLWAVGGLLEWSLGRPAFLGAYLGTGMAAGLLHAAANAGSTEPAIGASGAVAGLMGLFAVRHGRSRLRFVLVAAAFAAPRIHVLSWPAWIFLGLWLLEQLFFASFGATKLGVAFLAHLGGFAAGAALGACLEVWAPRAAEVPE